MARKRKGLRIDGVLLLDKGVGASSNFALQKARRLLNAQKAGHTGTLDPLASGLLPLCFGEATKFSADLLDAEKEYIADIAFGRSTTTGDMEGETLEEKPADFTVEDLEAALKGFIGETEQIPPMYSALKKDGVALYKLARSGETVERKPRKVVISRLDLLNADLPRAVVRVACSKGTYVRVLAEDIGRALGTVAHLTALRRIRVGDVKLEGAVTIEALENADEAGRLAMLKPADSLISTLPVVRLDEVQTEKFRHGQRITVSGCDACGRVRVYGPVCGEVQLLGCAQLADQGLLTPERLVTFEPN